MEPADVELRGVWLGGSTRQLQAQLTRLVSELVDISFENQASQIAPRVSTGGLTPDVSLTIP
jgi:hypothetical protein